MLSAMVANDNIREVKMLDPGLMAALVSRSLDANVHPEVASLFVVSAFMQKVHLPVNDFVEKVYGEFFDKNMDMSAAISRCVLHQSDHAETLIGSPLPEVVERRSTALFQMLDGVHRHHERLFPSLVRRCQTAFAAAVDRGEYGILITLDEIEHSAGDTPVKGAVQAMRRHAETHIPGYNPGKSVSETVASAAPSRP